jgi:hypothetical protein
MAYTIGKPKQQFLDVYVGDAKRPKRVPLAGSMPAPWLIRHNKITTMPEDERGAAWFEFYYDLFRAYVGPQVEQMTADQLNELAEAWADAIANEQGGTAGE